MKTNSITLLVAKTNYRNTAVFQSCFSFSLIPPCIALFGGTAGRQCGCNALFSICWSVVRDVCFWKLVDLDYFLVEGAKLYKLLGLQGYLPAGIYLLKINNRNTRTRCEICSKLTIKTSERCFCGVFIVNFEHISHLVLEFLFLTLSK